MVKTKEQMALDMQRIVELKKKGHELFTGDMSKWVELGLLNQYEYAVYKKIRDIEARADIAGRIAEEAVEEPDINSLLPPEFVKLEKELDDLLRKSKACDAFRDSVSNIDTGTPRRWGYSELDKMLDLAPWAKRAIEVYDALPSEYDYGRYGELKKSIAAKEREGTIVRRTRIRVWDDYRDSCKEAHRHAVELYRAEHIAELEKLEELKNLMDKRRAELIKPIKAEIKQLLMKIVKEGKDNATR